MVEISNPVDEAEYAFAIAEAAAFTSTDGLEAETLPVFGSKTPLCNALFQATLPPFKMLFYQLLSK